MKKLMSFAAIFAAFALLFAACQPEDQPVNGGNNGPEDVETPGDVENNENNGNNNTNPPVTEKVIPEIYSGSNASKSSSSAALSNSIPLATSQVSGF
jgi:hypothetical protein